MSRQRHRSAGLHTSYEKLSEGLPGTYLFHSVRAYASDFRSMQICGVDFHRVIIARASMAAFENRKQEMKMFRPNHKQRI